MAAEATEVQEARFCALQAALQMHTNSDGSIGDEEAVATAWWGVYEQLVEDVVGDKRPYKAWLLDSGIQPMTELCLGLRVPEQNTPARWHLLSAVCRTMARMMASNFVAAARLHGVVPLLVRLFVRLQPVPELVDDGSDESNFLWALAVALTNCSKNAASRQLFLRDDFIDKLCEMIRFNPPQRRYNYVPQMMPITLFVVAWHDMVQVLDREELVSAVSSLKSHSKDVVEPSRTEPGLDDDKMDVWLRTVRAIVLATQKDFVACDQGLCRGAGESVLDYFTQRIELAINHTPEVAGNIKLHWSIFQLSFVIGRLAINQQLAPLFRPMNIVGLMRRALDCEQSEDEEKNANDIATCYALWHLAFDADIAQQMLADKALCGRLDELSKTPEEGPLRKFSKGALFQMRLCCKEDVTTGQSPDQTAQRTAKQQHVMISYSWKDQNVAHWLWKMLETAGFPVWIDVAAMSGSTLEAMAAAVEDSAVVLVCASAAYKDSAACRTEAEYAYSQRKQIVPIKCAQYDPDGWLGALLGTRLWYLFDLQDEAGASKQLEALVKALSAVDFSSTETPNKDGQSQQELAKVQKAQIEAEKVIRDLRMQLQQRQEANAKPDAEMETVKDFKGWVTKQGTKVKNWRERFMVFSLDGTLTYYTSPTSLVPKGMLYLKRDEMQVFGPDEIDWEFRGKLPRGLSAAAAVLVSVPGRELLFVAKTVEAAKTWVERLKTAPTKSTGGSVAAVARNLLVMQRMTRPEAIIPPVENDSAAQSVNNEVPGLAQLQALMLAQFASLNQKVDAKFSALEARLSSLESVVKKA